MEGFIFILVIIATALIIIGLIFASFVGKVAYKEGHSYRLWAFLGFFLGIFALVILESGVIAENKGYDFITFCLIGLFGGILTLLVSCLLPQSKTKVEIYYPNNQTNTKTESVLLKSSIISHSTTNKRWECPKCKELNVINASHCINCFTKKP